MKTGGDGAERRVPLTLIDRAAAKPPEDRPNGKDERVPAKEGDPGPDLVREERALQSMAIQLAAALEHLERALLVSKGTGLTGRAQEAFDAIDALQREAAREFGRKVGDRMGRESLWRVQKGVDTP